MKLVNYRDAGFKMPSRDEWQRINGQRRKLRTLDRHAALKQSADLRPRLRSKKGLDNGS